MEKEEIRKTLFQIEQARRKIVQNFLKEIRSDPRTGAARMRLPSG